MTKKLLVTCMAAVAIAGAAAAGAVIVTPIASVDVAPVVFGAPLPLDPATDLPTADQLTGVLAADGLMAKAVAKGQVPLTFAVSNIAPAGPGAASANVTATAAAMPATTQNITFVNQGGWKISRVSATAVLSFLSA